MRCVYAGIAKQITLVLLETPQILTDAYNLSHQGTKVDTDWEVLHVCNHNSSPISFGFHESIVTFLEDVYVIEEMIDEATTVAAKVGIPEGLIQKQDPKDKVGMETQICL